MSVEKYLQEQLGRKNYTDDEKLKSLELTDTNPKIISKYIIDDSDINTSELGEYVEFTDDEYNHFKSKSMIMPDKVTQTRVTWNWSDEHLEDYIVTIKKRKYADKFIYDVIQTGDAEITNKNNPFQGADRDVFSTTFDGYDFKFTHNFLQNLGIFE